jgi:hypothetical protein
MFSPDDPHRRSAEQKGWRCHRRRRHPRRRRFKEAFLFVFSNTTKAEKNEAQIASECKEMLMTKTMRSVSPKPTFRRKEKEEKDTADATSKKADGAFASSMHIAREEEVRNNISRRDFEISQPLLYVT